jgi:RNA polymerase sigma-70 factor (ECF subfamily)
MPYRTGEAHPMTPDDSSAAIQRRIDRLIVGDESARAALLECASARLTRLTHRMLNRDFHRVQRWEQTDDVLQGALLRLDRALRVVVPPTPRDFFRLAATIIRTELIRLVRHYYGPRGLGRHHWTPAGPQGAGGLPESDEEPSDLTHEPGRLAAWTELHRQAGALPDSLREVFDLLYYNGLSQAEAARVLGVSERTVKRRWAEARQRLFDALGGQLPW